MRILFKIAVLVLSSNIVFAQDPHFSQSEFAADINNAASVGMMESDFKLTGVYRTQWNTIPEGFKTYGVGFEQKLNEFSYGIHFISNNAGEASLHQNNINLKVSYNKVLSNRSSLRAGVSAGIIQQRFDPQKFQFDNQYEAGVGFNGALGNQETFDNTTQILPDLSAGLMYLTTIGKLENEIGLSLLHLNQPAASFYLDGETVYPLRTFFHVNSRYPVNEKMGIAGTAQFDNQATAKKVLIGAGIDYKIGTESIWNLNIASRMKDAIIISTGLKMKNIDLGISYDMHNSKLSNFTNGNGGVELTAAYYFNKNKKPKEEPNKEITESKVTDTDNDLVPDYLDECPTIPGLAKYNGCSDKDGDEIYDSIDVCPNLYGHPDNKGCPLDPIMDSDMDGLVDAVDECPFLKGLPEHLGCPDSDKDGISDKVDNCPFLKGTTKNNGCPERSINDINNPELNYLPNVHVQFETDESDIKINYFEKLNGVVDYLMEYPESIIYISGHTDNEGNPSYNYALGERRSFEVRDYFLKRGISPSRMSVISYGETKPIHRNNNVYGKAKNRRVEITIIQ